MKRFFEEKDFEGLRRALSANPSLANEGIPFDAFNTIKAHPLHRICDGVFNNIYTDSEAVEMAKILLEFGADIEGFGYNEEHDSPLIAAASLHADQVAVLYISHGANIHHTGTHGGTALHWAAWCGRDMVVNRLIMEHAEINKRCVDFKGTPLLWAVHGYKSGGGRNRHNQIECARMLLQAGADKDVPNSEGLTAIKFLDKADVELIQLLS